MRGRKAEEEENGKEEWAERRRIGKRRI